MTRIRDLLIAFRNRRSRQLNRNESDVSFEAFCNESPNRKYPETIKESSLDDFKQIPINNKKCRNKTFHNIPNMDSEVPNCRPSFSSIFLLILLLIILLILPIIYLLHCFGLIYLQQFHNNPIDINDQIHYNSNSKIRNFQPSSIINNNHHNNKNLVHLPSPPKPNQDECKLINNNDKFDCYPENQSDKDGCEARGCCWIPTKIKSNNLNTPYCFYPENFQTYQYLNVTESSSGLVAYMKRNYRTAYPDDIQIIKIIIKYESDSRLHIKIMDPLKRRFEPPYPEIPIVDKAANNLLYKFYIDPIKPGFKIIRNSDNTTIFDNIGLKNFIFSNQFLQISNKLPSNYIYGLGEHMTDFMLSVNWTKLTFFNSDMIPQFNKSLYGSHPFYLIMEKSGKSHGVFLLNSNAMDVILQPTPAITYRTIGGILDFYIFLGPTPSDVIKQYTDIIGKPFLPPYWGLGFHLCRFGYKTINDTKYIMERNINAGIPLDTQWNDIDYMIDRNDFTIDSTRYKDLPEFVKELHENDMHYIPIIDPGVSASEKLGSYPPYDLGIKMDIFVKNSTNDLFIGKVWNRYSTVWPDFTHPNTVDYWTNLIRDFHNKVAIDGIWIDMNEPANLISGSLNGCPKNHLENPPYLPGVSENCMYHKTICMSAKHFAGLHYDVHNLYGISEAIVTNFALAEIRGKRPMVISRSTFAGHGHYAGHWSGDINSEWLDMKYTIPQLLSFSLFGIPLMGADICGFNKNSTSKLCNRWMQLGAFYPFSRNHNSDDTTDQDPVAMGAEVVLSSKKALTIRYTFLPYLYTLFWQAYVNGDTVARPLFFEFPNDSNTYDIDEQFLWGPAFMIVPVLNENALKVNVYLPSSIWYDYYSKKMIKSNGKIFNLPAPIDTIPLLIRGGYILPQQKAERTTIKSRKNKIDILAALDIEGNAYGKLYWDDGDSLNSYEEKRYSLIKFTIKNDTFQTNNIYWSDEKPPNFGSITILGVTKPVKEVLVNKLSQAFKYDTINKYLLIDGLNIKFDNFILIIWRY